MPSKVEQRQQLCGDFRAIAQSGAKEQVELELQHILESRHFRASHRSSIFLRHVVEKALAGQFDAVKERVLGVELFGRDSLFNTDRDSVVRVAANDVRRRLAEYYADRPSSAVRIELPPGVYIPHIQVVGAGPDAPHDPPAVSHPDSKPAFVRLANRRNLAALALVLCVAAIVGAAIRRNSSSAATSPARTILPWSAILNPGKRVGLVLADANLVFAKLAAGKDISIGAYADHTFSYADGLSGGGAAYLNFTPLAPVSDAVLAVRIAALATQAGSHVQIKYCSRMDSSDLKGEEPLILLGSSTSNPWVELLDDQLDFPVVHRYDLDKEVCVNRHPRTGELPQYVSTRPAAGLSEGYAVIALLRNLTGRAPLLMIAGTSTESTEAAGEFVTDLDRLADTVKRLGIPPDSHPQHLELLIKTSFLSANAAKSELVTFRVR